MPKIDSFSRNGHKKQYFCLFVNCTVHQASNKLASYKLFSIVSDMATKMYTISKSERQKSLLDDAHRTLMALQIYTVATVWYFVMHK